MCSWEGRMLLVIIYLVGLQIRLYGEFCLKGNSELTEKTICYYLGFIVSGVEWGTYILNKKPCN